MHGKRSTPFDIKRGYILDGTTPDLQGGGRHHCSPITVVMHHREEYGYFTVSANINNGTGTLTLVHMNPTQSISYHMTLRNGLWFYEYNPTFDPKPSINRLNNACMSNLWHGHLAHASEDAMDEINKHVIVIDRSLKQNQFNKRNSCLPSKMSKQPRKHKTKYNRNHKFSR